MNLATRSFLSLLFLLAVTGLQGAVPALLNYQGRILVGSSAFNGPAQFKFALVDETGELRHWGNSPDLDLDGEPDRAITLTLERGLYTVLLGRTNLPDMAAIPGTVFTNQPLFLRVWFNDGTNGFEVLSPDHQLGSVGHAVLASTVEDGAITSVKLAEGVLGATNLIGVLAPDQIPDLDTAKIVSGRLDPERLPLTVAHTDTHLAALSNSVLSSLQASNAALSAQLAGLSNELRTVRADLAGATTGAWPVVSPYSPDTNLVALGYQRFLTIAAPAWTAGSSDNQPSARHGHANVWIGDRWFVWGGTLGAGTYSAGGGLYGPATDAWETVATVDAPPAATGAKAAWSGDEILVWGGFSGAAYLQSGGRYRPSTGTWTLPPTNTAPAPRDGHGLVWTGNGFLLFGGRNQDGLRNDAALFDPTSGSWSQLIRPNAPAARFGAVCVWAGDRLLVWGGEGETGQLDSGAQLIFTNGVASHWQAFTSIGAPSPRSTSGAVWTGDRLLVWGGVNGAPLAGGGSYDPVGDTWQTLPNNGAPSPRNGHAAVWTGTEFLVVSGETAGGVTATGGAFDPSTGLWRTLPVTGSPVARTAVAGAWTGEELVLFGGRAGSTPLASLQRLVPQPALYLYRKP